MKSGIHPEYKTVTVQCACGASWTTRSTKGPELRLEICSNCHPFFTGKQKLIDSAGRVERYTRKYANSPTTPPKPKKVKPPVAAAPPKPKKEPKPKKVAAPPPTAETPAAE